VYNGAGKVPPAPLSATTGVEAVVVSAGVVVVVEVVGEVMLVDVEVVVREVVTIGVVAAEFVVVAIDWVVEVGWVVVMEVVVALLQAVKTKAVISSIDVRTMIHFLLNLFNNSIFSFSLFTFIMKGHL
jgi:hypothetical protein